MQARRAGGSGVGSDRGNAQRPAGPLPEPGGPKARRLPSGPGHPRQILVAGGGPGLLFQRRLASGQLPHPAAAVRVRQTVSLAPVFGRSGNCCATSGAHRFLRDRRRGSGSPGILAPRGVARVTLLNALEVHMGELYAPDLQVAADAPEYKLPGDSPEPPGSPPGSPGSRPWCFPAIPSASSWKRCAA